MGSLGYSVRFRGKEVSSERSLDAAKESAKYHLTSSESPLKEQEELDEAAVPPNHKQAMINHYGPGKVTINKKDGMISHTGNGETNSHAYDPNEKQPIGHHVGTVTVAEEVDQIDEISSTTLISYSQQAHDQIKGNQPADPDKLRKRTNREQGIKLAFNKHYQVRVKVPATIKEEELDEIYSIGSTALTYHDHIEAKEMTPAEIKAKHKSYLDTEAHHRKRSKDPNITSNQRMASGAVASAAKMAAAEWKHKYVKEEADQIDEVHSHRKVNDLKSGGKPREAGVFAAKSGHLRQYGPHFGMRSDKEKAQRLFLQGYDSVNTTNEEAKLDEMRNDAVTAAVTQFASQAHEDWRKTLPPSERNKPRLRSKNGGPEADINVPFEKLHPTAQQENISAGKAALQAVKKHPNDMESAADHVHKEWIKRNPKTDYNAHLHVPYSKLPEVEKQKDRDHVDTMKSLLGKKQQKIKPLAEISAALARRASRLAMEE